VDKFNEIIFQEFGYDVNVAEQLTAKYHSKLETYNEQTSSGSDFALPEIHFPGLGFIRIEFVPEEHNGEETF
tara:strand:+ start:3546 stop:3761 length:216 start_codon:yes stop_codon:yes gene_type:complete